MRNNTIYTFSTVLLFLSLSWSSCSYQEPEVKEEVVLEADTLQTSVPDKNTEQNPLEYYKTLNGQYPSDTHLFKEPYLQNRLINLLGKDQNDFFQFWEVETPVIIEDNILFTTGCQQHNCNANQFILIIDLAKDNINIFRVGMIMQEYEEKGTIKLPPKIEEEFNIILDNIM